MTYFKFITRKHDRNQISVEKPCKIFYYLFIYFVLSGLVHRKKKRDRNKYQSINLENFIFISHHHHQAFIPYNGDPLYESYISIGSEPEQSYQLT